MFETAAQGVNQGPQEPIRQFLTRLEQAGVKRSLHNLMTVPCINVLVGRGKLQLHGAYFGVAEGSLSVLDHDSGEFREVTESFGG